jgi:hypothetical protein
MPYKDPIKEREAARLRQQKFRALHKTDQVYISRRRKENKKCWNKNKEYYNMKNMENYYANREERIEKMREYNQKTRDIQNEQKKIANKLRRKIDSQFLIKSRLRCLIYNSVKLYGKGATVEKSKKYGLNLNEIAEHLSKTKPLDFNEKSYHIDHITPVSHFDLTNPEQVKKAFDKSNLQWLQAIENIKKSDKIIS